VSKHVKIRSKFFLNAFDGLLSEESSTGRLYVRTFSKRFFPENVANLFPFIEVTGRGPIYDEFMSQVRIHRMNLRKLKIVKCTR
jgi:hypothetical protein